MKPKLGGGVRGVVPPGDMLAPGEQVTYGIEPDLDVVLGNAPAEGPHLRRGVGRPRGLEHGGTKHRQRRGGVQGATQETDPGS